MTDMARRAVTRSNDLSGPAARGDRRRLLAAVALGACLTVTGAIGASLDVPFDFSREAIGLDVTIRGMPLYALLDTGVDPSMVDLERADTLGLKVDRAAGGQASGVGDSASAPIYPTVLDGLAIGDQAFGPFRALAGDTGTISASYGRRIDAIVGFSFLADKAVLVEYPAHRIRIAAHGRELTPAPGSCRTRWAMPLRFLADDNTPIIAVFRFGPASGPATLDTGSNSAVTLYPRAVALPGVRAVLVEKGEITHTGTRGDTRAKTYVLNGPVGFGPFILPAGQVVKIGQPAGPGDLRVANLGNPVFAALKLNVLLDYPSKRITFYGECAVR